jgi:hypothetical protein
MTTCFPQVRSRVSPVELRDQRHLVWETQEGGKTVRYDREPARGEGQRLQVELLLFLPLDREL